MMLNVINEVDGGEEASTEDENEAATEENEISEQENQLVVKDNAEGISLDTSLADAPAIDQEGMTHLLEIEYLGPRLDEEEEQKESIGTVTVPITLCLILMISYICGGAVLFGEWEGLSFLDGCYFCFITLSTIGFGDIVPGDSALGQTNASEGGIQINPQFIFCSMYIILGMAVIAMCFNLMQEKVVQSVTSLGKKLGVIKEI
jgi:hypothetical protein